MLEAGQILAFFSAVLLIAALAAWVTLYRRPALHRLDGSAAAKFGNFKCASQLLALAVGFSAVSALLAVAGWFAT